LIEANPEGAATPDNYGRLALHYVAGSRMNWAEEACKTIIESFPAGIHHVDGMGDIALCEACRNIGTWTDKLTALLMDRLYIHDTN